MRTGRGGKRWVLSWGQPERGQSHPGKQSWKNQRAHAVGNGFSWAVTSLPQRRPAGRGHKSTERTDRRTRAMTHVPKNAALFPCERLRQRSTLTQFAASPPREPRAKLERCQPKGWRREGSRKSQRWVFATRLRVRARAAQTPSVPERVRSCRSQPAARRGSQLGRAQGRLWVGWERTGRAPSPPPAPRPVSSTLPRRCPTPRPLVNQVPQGWREEEGLWRGRRSSCWGRGWRRAWPLPHLADVLPPHSIPLAGVKPPRPPLGTARGRSRTHQPKDAAEGCSSLSASSPKSPKTF